MALETQSLRGNLGRIAIIAGLIAFTLSLHYMWLPFPHEVHLLHRRLCYVPIILGALWFGLRGGLASAGAISFAVLPLALRNGGPLWGNEELVEILFYFGIGALAGFLVDRGKREREKKQGLELELIEAERLASAGRTAAGIAHEVRTPLASVQGSVEILAEDFPSDHPRRPYYDILAEETGRLKHVMDDFLDLNRPVSIAPKTTEIRPFLDGCLAALAASASAAGVTLTLAPTEVGSVRLDAGRMRQVVTNLLRNAIQASPRQGVVRISCVRSGDELLLQVEDSGPGIPDADLERIFEPFFTKKSEGVGLGLSLARQIVAAHGGTLEASNLPGGGARFTVRLSQENR